MPRAPGGWELETEGSGRFGEELEGFRRSVGQGVRLLGGKLATADRLGGGEVDDEGEDLHLGAAEGGETLV